MANPYFDQPATERGPTTIKMCHQCVHCDVDWSPMYEEDQTHWEAIYVCTHGKGPEEALGIIPETPDSCPILLGIKEAEEPNEDLELFNP